jgi:hypothetical protein
MVYPFKISRRYPPVSAGNAQRIKRLVGSADSTDSSLIVGLGFSGGAG